MAKFNGKIGYATLEETSPGVWTETITERRYYGDVKKNTRVLQTSDQVNDNVGIANEISIVADPFAYQNFHSIRYVTYMGSLWKVKNIAVEYPRLLLTLGGLYNGEQA